MRRYFLQNGDLSELRGCIYRHSWILNGAGAVIFAWKVLIASLRILAGQY